jgi:ribosomal protein L20
MANNEDICKYYQAIVLVYASHGGRGNKSREGWLTRISWSVHVDNMNVSRFKSISEMMDVDELEVDAKSEPKGSTLSLNLGRHEVWSKIWVTRSLTHTGSSWGSWSLVPDDASHGVRGNKSREGWLTRISWSVHVDNMNVSRFKSISEMMDVDELEVDAKSKPWTMRSLVQNLSDSKSNS